MCAPSGNDTPPMPAPSSPRLRRLRCRCPRAGRVPVTVRPIDGASSGVGRLQWSVESRLPPDGRRVAHAEAPRLRGQKQILHQIAAGQRPGRRQVLETGSRPLLPLWRLIATDGLGGSTPARRYRQGASSRNTARRYQGMPRAFRCRVERRQRPCRPMRWECDSPPARRFPAGSLGYQGIHLPMRPIVEPML